MPILDLCRVPDAMRGRISRCQRSYSILDEEKGEYTWGWRPMEREEKNTKNSPWVYRNMKTMGGEDCMNAYG